MQLYFHFFSHYMAEIGTAAVQSVQRIWTCETRTSSPNPRFVREEGTHKLIAQRFVK